MSGITKSDWIWKDGEFIRWEDANVHILSLAVQFGSSIFEGIRCYKTAEGPAIFRLDAHLKRLGESCKIYRYGLEVEQSEWVAACVGTVARNDLDDCYVRPMVVRGFGDAGMLPVHSPVESYVCAWKWGAYLGEEALETGVDCCTSTWFRPAPNTFPSMAKSAGHYNNSQLMKMEAHVNGYAEAIALSPAGIVSEGSGQNLFVVADGVLITPSADATWLWGVTRDAVITIARDLGIEVRQQEIPREMLYVADELFFTGTATEIAPIRSVDKIEVGSGRRGPVTTVIQERFLQAIRGKREEYRDWLTPVPSHAAAASG